MGTPAESAQSVWQRVLGPRFGELAPELRAYFARLPDGTVGVGVGVYEVAGPRVRWMRPVLAWLAWRHILFPERGQNVPFEVRNTPLVDGGLRGERTFRFPDVTRIMDDEMRVVATGPDARLHDFLGRRGGLEVELCLAVESGELRMTSSKLWLRLGPLRVRMPRFATIDLRERFTADGQRVDVTLHSPLIGTWFEYRGRFSYRYAPAS